LAVVFIFAGLSLGPGAAQPQASEARTGDSAKVLEAVFRDWQTLRRSVSVVRYVVSGSALIPAGALDSDLHPQLLRRVGRPFPKQDYTHDYRVHGLFDFSRNKYRLEIESEILNASVAGFNPLHELYVFDGKELRRHRIAVTRHRGSIYSARQPEFRYHTLPYPVFTMEVQPMLLAHGVILCAADAKTAGQLRFEMDPRRFAVHGTGVLHDQQCLVIRTWRPNDPFGVVYELWVQPNAGSRVRRVRRFEKDRLESSLDIDYEASQGRPVLKGWNYRRMDPSGQAPRQLITVAVERMELNPGVTDGDFRLEPSPEMIVRDDRTKEIYRLGPEGEHLAVGPEPRRDSRAWVIAASVIVVVLLAVGGLVLRLRFRARGEA